MSATSMGYDWPLWQGLRRLKRFCHWIEVYLKVAAVRRSVMVTASRREAMVSPEESVEARHPICLIGEHPVSWSACEDSVRKDFDWR